MSGRFSPRRSPRLGAWLALIAVVLTILAIALLGLWAWQQAAQIQMLRGELAQHNDRHQASEQIAKLQTTATALELHLASLSTAEPQPDETATGAGQRIELQSSLEQVNSRLDRLEAAVAGAISRIEALEGVPSPVAKPLPSGARLLVTARRQTHDLSCEAAAAAMAAQYLDLPLTEAEVLAALPRADNPYLGFRGNVDGSPGGVQDYGVYAGPILDVLNARGLEASLVEGGTEGIKAAIVQGHPVIAWITYDCQASTPITRTIGGEIVSLVPYQHAVLVTGYDSNGVWANDPWDGQEDYYLAADFGRALAYFNDMAVEVAAP